jgi:type II secretory pathway pseudopilin PulG
MSMASVILGALAAIAVFSITGATSRAGATACTADVRNVRIAEDAFYAQSNAYASTIDGLTSAGLLKSGPPAGEVAITLVAGPPSGVTVTGSAGSKCAGFVG